MSRSRALVESFLALRDFSDPSISGFRDEWSALSEAERDEARDALWFHSLVRALRDEIKTQKALAGLAGGEAALSRARTVWKLGEHLEVSEQLPVVEPAVTEAPAGGPGLRAPAAAPAPGCRT